jgi:hypothetical protein
VATTFLPVNTSTRLGADLRRAVDQLRDVRDRLERLKNILDTQVDGTIYTLVESQFGLQAGDGQTAYNLVAGAFAAVDVAAVQQLINRAG